MALQLFYNAEDAAHMRMGSMLAIPVYSDYLSPGSLVSDLIIIPGLAQTFVIFPSAERPRFAGYTDFIIPWVASEEDNFLLSLPLAAQLESLSQSALPGSPIETDPVPLGLSSSEGSGSLDLESEQLGTLTPGSSLALFWNIL
ncbi:uncharacterized protein EI90DRAFT_3123737 [Cantharellus anzutake]|uniref:uncharacterized protein n=1 Tax=Cantharellus anzutake TaxID=1750568 RepID=UPI0019086814|nr:uncharacterized protein EI90DRAFT_3123737 [Cantharellus anzutake]KAF8331040.1 hypothetical protein EI90DRAFT_3123737 [Cantharellus anzutake]